MVTFLISTAVLIRWRKTKRKHRCGVSFESLTEEGQINFVWMKSWHYCSHTQHNSMQLRATHTDAYFFCFKPWNRHVVSGVVGCLFSLLFPCHSCSYCMYATSSFLCAHNALLLPHMTDSACWGGWFNIFSRYSAYAQTDAFDVEQDTQPPGAVNNIGCIPAFKTMNTASVPFVLQVKHQQCRLSVGWLPSSVLGDCRACSKATKPVSHAAWMRSPHTDHHTHSKSTRQGNRLYMHYASVSGDSVWLVLQCFLHLSA